MSYVMADMDGLTDNVNGDQTGFEVPYTLMVDFHDTESHYSLYEDLSCKLSFKDNFKVDDLSECTVNILKVGWERSQDALLSTRISDTSIFDSSAEKQFLKGVVYTIYFPSSELLHHTDREYYQFCFLWQNSVLGASQPFQIQESESSEADASDIEIIKEGDLEWWYETSGKNKTVSDLDEPIFVPSERKIIEDTLERVMEENTILKQNKKEVLNEMDALREQLLDYEKQKLTLEKLLLEKSNAIARQTEHLMETEQIVKKLTKSNEDLEYEDVRAKTVIQRFEDRISELSKENESLLHRIKEEYGEEKSKIIRVHEIQLWKMKELFHNVEQELSYEKTEKEQIITKVKEEKMEFQQHVDELWNKIRLIEGQLLDAKMENEELVSKVLEKKESYLVSIEDRDRKISDLVNQLEERNQALDSIRHSSKEMIEELKQNLAKANSDVTSKTEQIKSLEEQFLLQQQGSESVEALISEVEEGKRKEKELIENIENLEEKIEKCHVKINELQTECVKSKGTRHALKVAYAHMEQKNTALRDERDDVVRVVQGLKKQLGGTPSSVIIEEQNKEIEDLKLRLCMGSNAFKEKFLECRKYEQELKRLKGTPSKSTKPHLTLQRSCSAQAPDVTDVYGLNTEVFKTEHSMLRQENAELRAKLEESEKDLVIVKSRLQESQSSLELTRSQLKEKESGISLQDSLLGEERQRNLQSHEEIRRLEDVIQAKDAEIRQLKRKIEQETAAQPPSTDSMMDLVESKEMHEKKIENLRLECEKYKKILSGVSKVIHNKKDIKDPSLGRDSSNSMELKSQPLLPDVGDSERVVGFPSPVLQEPHMESIRDSSQRDNKKVDSFSSPKIRLPGIYQQKVPGTSAPASKDVSVKPKDTTLKNSDAYKEEKSTRRKTASPVADNIISCPVCMQPFPAGTSDRSIALHVNKHFEY